MRLKECMALLLVVGLGIMTSNFVGFKVAFLDSLPGVLVLLGIALIGFILSKCLPLKLPIVAYCSIIGLLLACPISPVAEFVISATAKINFTAPLTIVGAFAGISIGQEVKTFAKQGWKMVLLGILVMTGTFIGSALISQIILSLTQSI
ncbi:MAG: hypothetical protein ACRCW2_10790 [Cellulosilyticaceae bacterium]